MRRIISVLAVMAVMAALFAASAVPAFAAASENAGCKGLGFSELEPGTNGPFVSEVAQERGGLGQFLGPLRSCGAGQSPH